MVTRLQPRETRVDTQGAHTVQQNLLDAILAQARRRCNAVGAPHSSCADCVSFANDILQVTNDVLGSTFTDNQLAHALGRRDIDAEDRPVVVYDHKASQRALRAIGVVDQTT